MYCGFQKVSKSVRMVDSNVLLLSMKLQKSTRISACEGGSTIRRRNFYEENGAFRNTLQTGGGRRFLKSMRHGNYVISMTGYSSDSNPKSVADLVEGPGVGEAPPPLFWMKKEEMTEGRKAGWASKIEPGLLLSSKSGSATENGRWL